MDVSAKLHAQWSSRLSSYLSTSAYASAYIKTTLTSGAATEAQIPIDLNVPCERRFRSVDFYGSGCLNYRVRADDVHRTNALNFEFAGRSVVGDLGSVAERNPLNVLVAKWRCVAFMVV